MIDLALLCSILVIQYSLLVNCFVFTLTTILTLVHPVDFAGTAPSLFAAVVLIIPLLFCRTCACR